jgi:uncharacterized lipoprotein YmbA
VQPDLTRYYVLTTNAAANGKSASPAPLSPALLLRTVDVPSFLRGKIMQVRVGENELKFNELARWAEPLESGVTRVLREDLEQGASPVRVVSRGDEPHDYEVAVRLLKFEGLAPAGVARLSARIEIFSAGLDRKRVVEDVFTTEIAHWRRDDYGDLAEKLSEATAKLADRIVGLLPAEGSGHAP